VSAHAYPLPSFPGRTQEDLLGQLLRKKLQPPVEDWIEEGARLGAHIPSGLSNGHSDLVNGNGTTNGVHTSLSGKELEDLWNWAGPEGNRIAREIGDEAFNDVFTLAEQEEGIEDVVTGLRRKFWESDGEDEDDGEEKTKLKAEEMDLDVVDDRPDMVKMMHRPGIDESRPMMPLESLLRFVSQGRMPPGSSSSSISARPAVGTGK